MWPIVFSLGHPIKVQGRIGKNRWFWAELGVSGLQLQFEFIDGYEIMHKAWNRIDWVPYCFSVSSIKFQGHTGCKTNELVLIWAFPVGNSNSNYPMDNLIILGVINVYDRQSSLQISDVWLGIQTFTNTNIC